MNAGLGGPFAETRSPLPPAAKANILRKYGLDQPLWVQYGRYVWQALHGDFGIPYQSPTETVVALLARVWLVTLPLGAVGAGISCTVWLGLAVWDAGRH